MFYTSDCSAFPPTPQKLYCCHTSSLRASYCSFDPRPRELHSWLRDGGHEANLRPLQCLEVVNGTDRSANDRAAAGDGPDPMTTDFSNAAQARIQQQQRQERRAVTASAAAAVAVLLAVLVCGSLCVLHRWRQRRAAALPPLPYSKDALPQIACSASQQHARPASLPQGRIEAARDAVGNAAGRLRARLRSALSGASGRRQHQHADTVLCRQLAVLAGQGAVVACMYMLDGAAHVRTHALGVDVPVRVLCASSPHAPAKKHPLSAQDGCSSEEGSGAILATHGGSPAASKSEAIDYAPAQLSSAGAAGSSGAALQVHDSAAGARGPLQATFYSDAAAFEREKAVLQNEQWRRITHAVLAAHPAGDAVPFAGHQQAEVHSQADGTHRWCVDGIPLPPFVVSRAGQGFQACAVALRNDATSKAHMLAQVWRACRLAADAMDGSSQAVFLPAHTGARMCMFSGPS